MTLEEKELRERIEAIEKRLHEINMMIELAEKKRTKTIINMNDGPIMFFGKHNIKDEDLNKKTDDK